MELQKSETMPEKFIKFVPSRAKNEGWHYYEIFGSDLILGIRIAISKIYVVTEKGGEPHLINGISPMFEWKEEKQTKFLTPTEYKQLLESGYEIE